MSSINENGELNGRGAADTGESIEGSLNGAPSVEDIVDEDDSLAIDAACRNKRLLWRT